MLCGGRSAADGGEDGDEFVDLRGGEQAFRPLWCEGGEGRFVEQGKLHGAVPGEVLDDQADKIDLVPGKRLARKAAGQRIL